MICLKRVLIVVFGSSFLLLSSCSHLNVYITDHGTYEIKSTLAGGDTNHMIERFHFRSSSAAFYFFVDEKPGKMFWYDSINNYSVALFWSDLNGNGKDSTLLPGLRRLAIDRYKDLVVWEVNTIAGFVLKARRYDQLKSGPDKILTFKPSQYTFSSLVVNPDNSRKIFWVERRASDAVFFMEMDMISGETTELLNSQDHPYVKKFGYIAVDTIRQHIYWSQNLEGSKNDLIGRASYKDGSHENWIYNVQGGLYLVSYPAQIAIDQKEKQIFWADMNHNWLISARMEGKNLKERKIHVITRFRGDQPSSAGKCPPQFHPTSVGLTRISGPNWGSIKPADGNRVHQKFLKYDEARTLGDPILPENPKPLVFPFE
jgi:hypothetical protein